VADMTVPRYDDRSTYQSVISRRPILLFVKDALDITVEVRRYLVNRKTLEANPRHEDRVRPLQTITDCRGGRSEAWQTEAIGSGARASRRERNGNTAVLAESAAPAGRRGGWSGQRYLASSATRRLSRRGPRLAGRGPGPKLVRRGCPPRLALRIVW